MGCVRFTRFCCPPRATEAAVYSRTRTAELLDPRPSVLSVWKAIGQPQPRLPEVGCYAAPMRLTLICRSRSRIERSRTPTAC